MANRFKGLDLIECLKNYGQKFMTLYRRWWSRPFPRKRNAERQNGCLRSLKNHWEKKRKERQRRKGKIHPSESVQFSSVAQLCLTLCDPMNRSTPGLPVHHHLAEFTQTHVHRVSDAIQPSHPLSSPSPAAPNPSQHQSFPMSQLFAWGGQSTGVSALASFLPKKSQGWSPSEWIGPSKGPSRVFSNTTVQKHQFFSTQLSPQSNSHIHTWPLENHSLD